MEDTATPHNAKEVGLLRPFIRQRLVSPKALRATCDPLVNWSHIAGRAGEYNVRR
jgi:hypothetical protein